MTCSYFIQKFIDLSRSFDAGALKYSLAAIDSNDIPDDFIIPIESIEGIKSKDKNSMHRIRVGYRKDGKIILTMDRITNSKLCGIKITKTCSLVVDVASALILSNVLHDMIEVIYERDRLNRINSNRFDS